MLLAIRSDRSPSLRARRRQLDVHTKDVNSRHPEPTRHAHLREQWRRWPPRGPTPPAGGRRARCRVRPALPFSGRVRMAADPLGPLGPHRSRISPRSLCVSPLARWRPARCRTAHLASAHLTGLDGRLAAFAVASEPLRASRTPSFVHPAAPQRFPARARACRCASSRRRAAFQDIPTLAFPARCATSPAGRAEKSTAAATAAARRHADTQPVDLDVCVARAVLRSPGRLRRFVHRPALSRRVQCVQRVQRKPSYASRSWIRPSSRAPCLKLTSDRGEWRGMGTTERRERAAQREENGQRRGRATGSAEGGVAGAGVAA
ncbi:hypothetical protein C2E23DRAFT_809351 [Lenzites betulinus]|nr:hypothetical protein C2E23DRAFT_809302 [Lenzites betulinus]KAH9856822.1 hypothetical protein C2E23DRAFT_809326 [Lenzites betulinus]KAH9856825.1 hypothetical protein C2E23DRAFT_809351 [Lenzites betulinus]